MNKLKEIKGIQAPIKSIVPQFSNVTTISTHDDFVVLDFGFVGPSYVGNIDDLEDSQVARIILPWDCIKGLNKDLRAAISGQNKVINKKVKNK